MNPFAIAGSILLASALPLRAQQPLACATAGTAAGDAAPLTAEERADLSAAERTGLGELRAAALVSGSELDTVERSSLRDLQGCHTELQQLRAGELTLSDDDIKLILITAGVVIIIALIL